MRKTFITLQKKSRTIAISLLMATVVALPLATGYFTGLNSSSTLSTIADSTVPLATAVSTKTTFASVSEMLSTNLAAGVTVTTQGFYSQAIGGGGTYLIKKCSTMKTNGTTVFALSNGLRAILQVANNTISVKQFGAYGDGTHDDSKIFASVITSGVSTVSVPAGTYNLNGYELKLPKFIAIVGEGASTTVLKNVNFVAPYGIQVESLTMDGGTQRTVANSYQPFTGTMMILTTPTGSTSVKYRNCVFQNTDYVSFGMTNGTGSANNFNTDLADGCSFINIGKIAIFHSIDSKSSSYTNNVFQNIGSAALTKGQIAAIWLGDITNCTNEISASVVISGNTFNTLTTGDDFNTDTTYNYINANFISIRADKAVISNNSISNLLGYGLDREAIYTKVRDLAVTGNYIANGGAGEGYICNKGAAGATSTLISGNTLTGSMGGGIRTYGTATIENNTIDIDNCKYAISTTPRSDTTSANNLTIQGNLITCGTNNTPTVNGVALTGYSSGSMIKVFDNATPTVIQNNTLNPESNFDTYIKVGSLANNASVSGNNIQAGNFSGIPIFIGSSDAYAEQCKQASISVTGNNIAVLSGNMATKIYIAPSSAIASSRSLAYTGNVLTFTGTAARSYAYKGDTGAGNGDSLYCSQNTVNLTSDMIIVSSNAAAVQNDDVSLYSIAAN